MNISRSYFLICLILPLGFSGCGGGFGGAASDLGLAGAGGVLGYKLSDGNAGVAAAGAGAGYLVSKVAQSASTSVVEKAEKAGYERGINQAVKQQYWIQQNAQKSAVASTAEGRLLPVVVSDANTSGGSHGTHIEYIYIER